MLICGCSRGVGSTTSAHRLKFCSNCRGSRKRWRPPGPPCIACRQRCRALSISMSKNNLPRRQVKSVSRAQEQMARLACTQPAKMSSWRVHRTCNTCSPVIFRICVTSDVIHRTKYTLAQSEPRSTTLAPSRWGGLATGGPDERPRPLRSAGQWERKS